MSRTNISVLLATALLGVLLWVVLSIARDAARAPAEPLPMPEAAAEPDPSLPRLSSAADFEAWLAARGYSASLIAGYREWLAGRGFRRYSVLLGTGEAPGAAAGSPYAGRDDAQLVTLAGQGDTAAAAELGERSLQTDPIAALEWFDQAIVGGSIAAMIRVADLLATLADPGLAAFTADPVWQAALQQVQAEAPPPRERALAWAVAAVAAGGYAVLDPTHASRIDSLAAELDAAAVDRACETAQTYLLQTATLRRARGGAIFSLQTPPLALSVADPDQALPCTIPLLPLVSLQECRQEKFVGPENRLMDVWLCTAEA